MAIFRRKRTKPNEGFEDPIVARDDFEVPVFQDKGFEDPIVARDDFEVPVFKDKGLDDPTPGIETP